MPKEIKDKSTTKKTGVKPSVKVAKKPVEKKVAQVAEKVAEVKVATGKGRVFVGKVVSDKMTKTVVVEVTRLEAHPLYHKRMRRSKGFHAHNEMGAVKNQWVEITECKPISKTKTFVVTKIISNLK